LQKRNIATSPRRDGKRGTPHEIEIWFGIEENSLYLLSGGVSKSDWVKNLLKDPSVTVRITKYTFDGIARIVNEKNEEVMARHMLAGKYQGWKEGQELSEWGRTALVVGIDLDSSNKT
jgi:nitroimidazol reductase NimA-like FMN-containing flavoprotein (pyridoxamine 5'-phosphate oxidase superfamily)